MKKKIFQGGLVYSTDRNALYDEQPEEQETLPASQQQLLIVLDTKQRAGKKVTLVKNFVGKTEDLEVLGKALKNACGTGGSVKEGCILIQGDYRDRIKLFLTQKGYLVR